MASLILIGAGGHAHACIDVIERHGEFQIAGLVGQPGELHACHLGYSVIAVDKELPQLAGVYRNAFIAVGQIKSPDTRISLFQQAASLGFQLPAIVSPTALVSRHAKIGAGTIVMHGAIVNAGAIVGDNCIINSRALVEHDATVEDHCHVATGAIINGGAHIGTGSFLGSGCIIREGIALGSRCVVGMGLPVRHDQPNGARFVGKGKS